LIPSVDLPRTIDYYLRRTSHGSTLSRMVHAWVLARFDRPRSWDLFTQSLDSDIADVQRGSTAEGVHLGAMAGTADLLQRCYGGVQVRPDYLSVRPALPEALAGMAFTIEYRGQRIHLSIKPDGVSLYAPPGGRTPIRMTIDGQETLLEPGNVSSAPSICGRKPGTCDLSTELMTRKLHSQLPATTLFGYLRPGGPGAGDTGASYLGPVIVAQSGIPVVANYTNNLASDAYLSVFTTTAAATRSSTLSPLPRPDPDSPARRDRLGRF
jgi:hypothetical protein